MRHFVLLALMTALAGCPADGGGFRPVAFPDDFAFGTAQAQWQAAGDESAQGPVDSNWSRWAAMGEIVAGQDNPRGNGFYEKFPEDIQRAKDLGLDTFRLGVDWSRIEPAPGVFDDAELDHLDAVLDELQRQGLKPVVTFWHWVVPLWVQNPDASLPGGKVDRIATRDRAVVDDFGRFVEHVVPRIKDRVDTYTVLNEPLVLVVRGYFEGNFPPGNTLDIEGATDFGINLMFMHARAFDVIKDLDDVDADGDGSSSFVGLTMTANAVFPEDPHSEQEQLAAQSMSYVYHDWVIQALTRGELDVNLDGHIGGVPTEVEERSYDELKNRLEFIGVQYYGVARVKDHDLFRNFPPLYGLPMADVANYTHLVDQQRPHTGMGFEIDAGALRGVLDRYAQWGLPLIITESGTTRNVRPSWANGEDRETATVVPPPEWDDVQGPMYIVEHLWEIGRAIERGVDIRGFYHWTLVDNFEWIEGNSARFGAYTVDFDDLELPRTLNTMGEALRDVISARGIDETLWQKWVADKYPSDHRQNATITTSEPVYGP